MPEKPASYGQWWSTNDNGEEWYTQSLFQPRQKVHDAFLTWAAHAQRDQPFDTVLEVGCGCATVYPAAFADARYVGLDISPKEIAWCIQHNKIARHFYAAGDIIETSLPPSDLVFSHAVIDHIYDVEAFLEAIVRHAKQWIYLTAYRGWFPDLDEHKYTWGENATCYFNDLSPNRLRQTLERLGCAHITVEPFDTGQPTIPQETRVIARR